MENFAVMNVDEGEEIAATLMNGEIPGTGHYKFLAKKRIDGKFEWAHFVQRVNGQKEKMYRGEAENEEQLKLVIEIMNRNLTRVFGPHAEMKPGNPHFYDLSGTGLKMGEA
jgi:hypothetical protein